MSDPTVEVPPVEDVTDDGRRSPVVVALVALAVVVVVGGLWFLVVAPLIGDDTPSAELSDAGTTVAPDPTEPGEDAPDADELDELDEPLPLVTYEVFLDRDPFARVVPVIDDASESTGTAPSDGSDADGSDADGTVDPDGGPSDSPSDNPSDDPSGGLTPLPEDGAGGDDPPLEDGTVPGGDGRTLSLVDIVDGEDGRVAIVQVGTTIYEVSRGDVFAGNFLLQDVGDDRVTIVYGDDVVALSVGDRVLK